MARSPEENHKLNLIYLFFTNDIKILILLIDRYNKFSFSLYYKIILENNYSLLKFIKHIHI